MTKSAEDSRGFAVLVVEDDTFKQELIEQTLRGCRPDLQMTLARSVQQAVQSVRRRPYDLIVLDIALPSHESRPGGAQPLSQPSGGVEILMELSYEGRDDPVVVLTQYPEIEYDGRLLPLSRFQRTISKNIQVAIISVLQFSPSDTSWRDQLKKVIL